MKIFVILVALGVAAVIGAFGLVYSGAYDVSATDQHLRPTFWALQTGLRQSVARRAHGIEAPPLDDPALVAQGLAHFRRHCVQCHGAPGVPPEPFALGLTPLPGSLSDAAQEWSASELYWVIRHGIKMTGMPAWQFRMSDEEMWSVVAFLLLLPSLTPERYAAMQDPGTVRMSDRNAEDMREPDAERGRYALRQFGCVGCHVIPGVVAAESFVGPPLSRMGTRRFVAGQLPNTRENLVRWIRDPQSISPGTAMPDLGVGERDAHDIAAYLARLR